MNLSTHTIMTDHDTETQPEQPNEDAGMWAIVEIMGHKRRAGFIRKTEEFGAPMLRIDIPANDEHDKATQFYGVHTIYCITPVDQMTATRAAAALRADPVSVYIPQLPERRDAELEIGYDADSMF